MSNMKTLYSESQPRSHPALWLSELNRKLSDRVRWDEVTLQLYSTAACLYEIKPLAVVIPESVTDIQTALQVCRQFGVPVLPRGAGSSLSGNAVGRAVILDLTHHFREIELLENDRVRCGVSVVLNSLQDRLKILGRKFGPDPSSGNVCVIGGMLGNNSGGPHTIRHGSMVRHVDEITVVLPDGELFHARNLPLGEIPRLDGRHRTYYERVKSLLEKHTEEIEASRPAATKNASGYQVWDVLTPTHLNLASLFVGSEGTLGVFTNAVLRTIPRIRHRGIISFSFTDLASMGQAVRHFRSLGASAIEFVDQSFLRLALSFRPDLREFLPAHVKYLLYVEFEDDDISIVEDHMHRARRLVCEEEHLAEVGSFSTNEEEIESVNRVRKAATVILNKIQGKEKPAPFVEDAAIHPDAFTGFLVDLSTLLQQYTFSYAIFGHAGDGNLHLRPIVNFRDPQVMRQAEDLMQRFVDLVVKHHGTLSGEHGDGRLRTPFLGRTFPRLLPLFRELKDLFDPTGILNPGIKVADRAEHWTAHLRYSPSSAYFRTSSDLDKDAWRTEIEKCHGCGTCREYCPVFITTGEEEATGRAKANILRKIISGKSNQKIIDTDAFFTIMDQCLNCGKCLTDCPTGVNIPGLAILAKQKLHEQRPYKLSEVILQHGKQVSALASTLPAVSNAALRSPLLRTAMDVVTGIDRRRTLPSFARRTVRAETPAASSDKTVVLWTGCAAQFNDPDGEIDSSVQLLEKLGYSVILPDWKCCNVAKLSYGNLDGARDDIRYNLNTLKPYVDKNLPIVFTSASCGYAFMHEYPVLFPEDKEIRKVAGASVDIHEFIERRLRSDEIEFSSLRMRIVYHVPCHLKSQKNALGPLDLLKRIPGLEILTIRDSCCGIAGTFGMKKENFDLSMKIGERLFSEIGRVGPELVVSGCGTCQAQISQGTGLRVLHPMTILNKAAIRSL